MFLMQNNSNEISRTMVAGGRSKYDKVNAVIPGVSLVCVLILNGVSTPNTFLKRKNIE
jgi:hypothetical protein